MASKKVKALWTGTVRMDRSSDDGKWLEKLCDATNWSATQAIKAMAMALRIEGQTSGKGVASFFDAVAIAIRSQEIKREAANSARHVKSMTESARRKVLADALGVRPAAAKTAKRAAGSGQVDPAAESQDATAGAMTSDGTTQEGQTHAQAAPGSTGVDKPAE